MVHRTWGWGESTSDIEIGHYLIGMFDSILHVGLCMDVLFFSHFVFSSSLTKSPSRWSRSIEVMRDCRFWIEHERVELIAK